MFLIKLAKFEKRITKNIYCQQLVYLIGIYNFATPGYKLISSLNKQTVDVPIITLVKVYSNASMLSLQTPLAMTPYEGKDFYIKLRQGSNVTIVIQIHYVTPDDQLNVTESYNFNAGKVFF